MCVHTNKCKCARPRTHVHTPAIACSLALSRTGGHTRTHRTHARACTHTNAHGRSRSRGPNVGPPPSSLGYRLQDIVAQMALRRRGRPYIRPRSPIEQYLYTRITYTDSYSHQRVALCELRNIERFLLKLLMLLN